MHRRRDSRRRLDQARLAPGPDPGAARPPPPGATCSGSGCRPPRTRSRRSAASWSARSAAAGWSTPACARSSTSRSTCRWSRWSSPTTPPRPSDRPARGRGGDPALDLAGDLPRAAGADPRPQVDDPVRQQPSRRRAAGHPAQRSGRRGAGPFAPRLAGARGAHGGRGDAQGRRAALSGGHLEPGAGHRYGRRRSGHPGRVAQVGGARAAAHRPRRPLGRRRQPRVGSSPSSAPTCSSARSSRGGCARRRSRPRWSRATRSTCSPSRSWPSRRPPATRSRSSVDDLFALVTRTHSYAELESLPSWRTCSTCSTAAIRQASSPSCARGSSGTGSPARSGRAAARASWPSPTPARSPTAVCTPSPCPTGAALASSTRRWSTRRVPARRSCSAPPPGGSRRSDATG